MATMVDKGLIRRITQALVRNPSWKIIVRNSSWLCPYCGEIGARHLRMNEQIEGKIARHLLRDCKACQNFTGPEIPIEELRRRAKLIVFKVQIGKWMLSDRRYSMGTDDGRWICPCCGVLTNVQLPEGDPREPATYGSKPEEHPFLSASSRHLLQCSEFEKQQVKSQAELDAIKAKIDRQARSGQVEERFRKEAEWQLVDLDRRWLCPFCASPTAVRFEGQPTPAFFKGIGEHLLTCRMYRTLRGQPRPVKYLKEKVAEQAQSKKIEALKQKIGARPIWRCRDSERRWYCPYCASAPGVDYPEKDAPDPTHFEGFVNEVLNHLKRCRSYKTRGAIRSKEEMLEVLQTANRGNKKRRELQKLVRQDERFQVVTDDRAWVCPYCVTTVEALELDPKGRWLESGEGFHDIADEMFDHFASCRAYTPGQLPSSTIDDVRAEMFQRSQELFSGDLGVTEITQEWSRLKAEVEALHEEEDDSGEAMLASLESARATRRRLLPNLPVIEGYDFGAEQIACEQLGGDFYDFFEITEKIWGVVMGGINDQGVEATLTMGLTKKLLQSHARNLRSACEVLEKVNADIYEELDEDTVVTVFFGFLNVENRAFMFARAGQNPIFVYNPRRSPQTTLFQTKGLALGTDEGPLFSKTLEQRSIQLAAGDILLQVSGGVAKACNDNNEPFGLERVQAVLEAYGTEDAEYLTWKLRKAVQEWQRGKGPDEDITVVAVKLL